MSGKGRSVRLFLVDGVSSGVLTAEIMNWTGHVLAGPRTRLEAAIARKELSRTGVYFLHGPDDEGSELDKVYVGEGDEISKRLYQHNKEKDFWERFVAITSKDMNLTKAHVRYLEGRFISILSDAKKSKIVNSTKPQFDLLPEADIADMEAFISEVRLVLPVIGFGYLQAHKISRKEPFKPTVSPSSSSGGSGSDPSFLLKNDKAGINARAQEVDGDFVILAGSIGSNKEKVSFHERLKSLRDEGFQSGRIELQGENNFKLIEDIAFSSPSAASVFLFGTARNGRTDWVEEESGLNYGAWKDALLAKVATEENLP